MQVSKFYGDIEEPIPSNAPKVLGKAVDLGMLFVDSDHMGDTFKHSYCTENNVQVNTALISWYSKKYFTIETCTFGTEFVAIQTNLEDL